MGDLTGDLLTAVVAADPERRQAALKFLRGETLPPAVKPVSGPLLMNMCAAARFLGVSRTTLLKIVAAGAIEKVEIFSGSYRVTRESLEALAARSLSGAPQAKPPQSGTIQFPLGKRGRPRKEATANSGG
jgi:hypothetical protein